MLALIVLVQVLPARGQMGQRQEEWAGRYKDGTEITLRELAKIISEHKRWLRTNKEEGNRADLSGADLRKANLFKADLSGADLATLSSRHSSFGAGANGGDLGWIARDDVVPDYRVGG